MIVVKKILLECRDCGDTHQDGDLALEALQPTLDGFFERHQSCDPQAKLPGMSAKGGRE